jgi:DNA modification methylase
MIFMKLQHHPIAQVFPLLEGTDLERLADDIREHGQKEPIYLFEGKILDGRNRAAACLMAGIDPQTKEFSGSPSDALAFVWSLNRTRRHLTSSQAAACEVERERLDSHYREQIEKERDKRKSRKGKPQPSSREIIPSNSKQDENKRTDAHLAKKNGTNRKYIEQARSIQEQRPDLLKKVQDGDLTIPQARTEMRREQKRKELEQKSEEAKRGFQDQPPWTLIQGDVTYGLGSVRDHHGPARLIFTDPPYNIGIQYGDHHNDSVPDQEFIAWCLKWMKLCRDCLTDDGSLWVMINDEYAADFVMNLRQCHLHMRAWIKWYETFGVNCSSNFNRTSRHILYFVVDPKNCVFNETAALRPSDRQTKYKDARAQSGGKILDDVWQIPRLTGTATERIPDVPTQLPLELVSQIVNIASEPGDLVVDPFNGSGTTGVAAVQSSRKYVGIDASEKFIDLADKRLRGAM